MLNIIRLRLVCFSVFINSIFISWPLLAENIWVLGSPKAGKSSFIAAALDYISEEGGELRLISESEDDEELKDFLASFSRSPFLPVSTSNLYSGRDRLPDITVSAPISSIPIPINNQSRSIDFNTTSVIKRYTTESGIHFVDTPGLTSENAYLVGETMRHDILDGNSVDQIIAFIQLDSKIENDILTPQESCDTRSALLFNLWGMFKKAFSSDKITLQISHIMSAIDKNLDLKKSDIPILFVFVPSHSKINPFENISFYNQIEQAFTESEPSITKSIKDRFLAAGLTLTPTRIAAVINDWGALYQPIKPFTLQGMRHYSNSLVKILSEAKAQRDQQFKFVESQTLINTRTALQQMHSGSFLNTFEQSHQQILADEQKALSELEAVNRDLNLVKTNLDALVKNGIAKHGRFVSVDEISIIAKPQEPKQVKAGSGTTTTTSVSDTKYTVNRLYFSKNDQGEAGVFLDARPEEFSLSDLRSLPTVTKTIHHSLTSNDSGQVLSTNFKFNQGGQTLNYRFELHGEMDRFRSRTLGSLLNTCAGYIPFHFRSSAISPEYYDLLPSEQIQLIATKDHHFVGADSDDLKRFETHYDLQKNDFRNLQPTISRNERAYRDWSNYCARMDTDYKACLTSLTDNGITHPKKFIEMKNQYQGICATIEKTLQSLGGSKLHDEASSLKYAEASTQSNINTLDGSIFKPCIITDSFPCNSSSYSFTKYEDLDPTVYSDVVLQSINDIIKGLNSGELSFQIDTDGTIVYRSTNPELLRDLVNTLFVPTYMEPPQITNEVVVEETDPEVLKKELLNEWLNQVKTNHSDENHVEFFKNLNDLPRGIVVIHGWETGIETNSSHPFGHVSLQIDDLYLSVHGVHRQTPYLTDSYRTDADNIGRKSQFLVLKLDEREHEDICQMVLNVQERVKSGSLRYKEITQHISLPTMDGERVDFDIQGGRVSLSHNRHQVDGKVSEKLQQRFDNKKWEILREYSGKGAGGGAVVCGVGGAVAGITGGGSAGAGVVASMAFLGPLAPVAIAAGAAAVGAVGGAVGGAGTAKVLSKTNRSVRFCHPEGDHPMIIKHSHYPINPKNINSASAVFSVFDSTSWLKSLVDEEFKTGITEEKIYLKAMGNYIVGEAMRAKNDRHRLWDTMTQNLKVKHSGKESRDKLDLVTSCIKENGHWKGHDASGICKILRDSIKSLGRADNVDQAVEDFRRNLEISEGRLALLFGNPKTLPESIMRSLARRLYTSKSDKYLYSSYEASLAPLLGTKVRIKNVASGRYLCAKDGSYHSWNEVVHYDYNDSQDKIFWMLPVGRDGKFYVLLSDKNKKALDLRESNSDRGTPLIVYNTHFGDSEQFRFVPEKSGDKDCVRIITLVGNKSIGADTKDNGSSVRSWDWIDNDSQRWIIEPVQ